jgi:hypothetical protein
VAEGLSKRDQKDVAAIRAAIERLQAQLKQPNADKAAIQQSIAHEQKRLALYKEGITEGRQIHEVFADQGSGSTDRDNEDYMKRRRAANKAAEAEKNPHTSALGRALYRDLSKEKKASPQQVQRNKERWAQRQAEREQDVTEGHKESYVIVRTDTEGKRDVFAGNFDTYERAQKELDACLAHPLHTKHKQKFEIKRKGHKDVSEGSVTKKPQPYNDPNWTKNLPKEKLDAIAGPRPNKDKKDKQGITEMDKSQTPPGRDTGPREGPEKIAKTITKEKMVKHALDTLTKSMAKKDNKKKDVSEAYPLGYSTDPAQGKWYQEGMDAVKYGTVGNSIKEIAKKHFVPPQWLEAFTAGFRQQEEWSREGAARGFPGGQKPEPYTTSKAMSVPPTFQPNTNARGGGGSGVMNPDPLAQLMRESGVGSEPLMKKLRRAMVQEGRVKELADDLKTMSDADFMKKYGKAKAAIRREMKRVDEAEGQTIYTAQEITDVLTGRKTQQQVDAERAQKAKVDDTAKKWQDAEKAATRVDSQGRRIDKNGNPAPPPKTWTNPPITPPPGNTQQYEGLNEQDAAGQQFVGTGTSSNWQMSVDIAAMNARKKAAQSIAGTANFPNGVKLPAGTKYGPQDTKSDGTGKYVSTYVITLPAPSQSAEPAPTAPGAALDSSPATSTMNGSMSTSEPAAAGAASGNYMKVNELSTNKLSQYKTAAAKDAKKADQAGDFKRGDKRLSGMVQATKKQFDNDAKKVDESRAARRALMARIANSR